MPTIAAETLTAENASRLLNSVVIPRPIAWVSTVDAQGRCNLAPHSYFNAVSAAPPIVMFASSHSSPFDPSGRKDTLRNIEETGEFVLHIVPEPMIEAMNKTSAAVPPGTDEFALAGLAKIPSHAVRPPRIAGVGVALECRLFRLIPAGDATAVFGEVRVLHIDDGLWQDGRVDPRKLQPLARLGGSLYAGLGTITALRRP